MDGMGEKKEMLVVASKTKDALKGGVSIIGNPEFEKPPGFSSSSSLRGNPRPKGRGIVELNN